MTRGCVGGEAGFEAGYGVGTRGRARGSRARRRRRVAFAAVALVGACAAGAGAWTVASPPTGYEVRVERPAAANASAGRCTVLLHGLARTSGSMRPLAEALLARGSTVAAVDYPSRAFPVETLAPATIARGLGACRAAGSTRIDVVTHSMGAILLRVALGDGVPADLGRVVMLGPPNAGSEVVDALAAVPGFAALNGPAGLQLGTGPDDVPARLGPTRADVAVVAGSRSINLLLSLLLPNPDDGKVSAARTRLEGMCGWLQVAATHPLMMRKPLVVDETIRWLETGRFASGAAEYPACPARSRGTSRRPRGAITRM